MPRPHSYLVCLVLLAGCRSGPPPAIDPAMASAVPASTIVLAGIDLDRLRASPLYPKLPAAAAALLDPLRDAHSLLIVSDGADLLTIARGPFRQPLPGATPAGKDLALLGSGKFLEAAIGQHRTGQPGRPGLIDYASTVAPGAQVWIAARGGVRLPLSGNAANLNRLLRDTEYSAVTVKLDTAVQLSFTARGRTEDAARTVEETARAILTMTAAAESRQPDVVALLRSVQLTRGGRTVRASLAAPAEAIEKLMGAALP